MRRLFYVLLAIVLLLGIGVGIYFGFFARQAHLSSSPGGASLPASGSEAAPTSGTPAQDVNVAVPGAGTDVGPRLVRITDTPVALGAVAVFVPGTLQTSTTTRTASSTPIAGTPADVRVEYVDRESGNIYAYQAHARTLTRLTNKTLPGIEEASWLGNGSLVYARFISNEGAGEHINTYALPANGDSGYLLEPDLAQVLTRGSTTLVTLLSTTDGSSATVSTPSGGNIHAIFSSPLSSIRLAFAGANYVAVTKPSAYSDGYAFLVDGKSGAFTRLLGPLAGLSALPSPSGTLLLYSYVDRGRVVLAILDEQRHTAIQLPLSTLAEKCAWAPDSAALYCGVPTALSGKLPDDWYQGAVSFSDRLWRIDLSTRTATLLVDPKQVGGANVDAVGLTTDQTADVLVFMNKSDGTLWAYDL